MICDMRQAGMTMAAIAGELERRGIRTARGGRWSATAVQNVIARLTALRSISAGVSGECTVRAALN